MAKFKSVKQLLQQKYKILEFEEPYASRYGHPEDNFKAMFYGSSGSGKSVEVIKFANYLAHNFGRVFYNSFEEGHGKTLQDRIIAHNIDSTRISFGNKTPYDDMLEKVGRGKYKFIVIDSLQWMGLTYGQYQKMVDRYPKKSFIIISHANDKGEAKGRKDILYAVDIKAHLHKGLLTVQSRFVQDGYVQERLFTPKSKKHTQLKMF
ncbi:MAG: hypothetical protein AAF587_29505 [Bacteroidota bacterium]